MSRFKPRLKAGLQLPKLIVILGPTASGKTDLALKLAKKFKGEVVSADSRQIYRGMDVGTGKIPVEAEGRGKLRRKTPIVFGGVKHYLLDIVNPDEEFSLADYKKMAEVAIGNILKRKKVPFLVGGTGLYIQAVVDNLEIPAVPPNKKLREKFEKEIYLTPHPNPLPQGERGLDLSVSKKALLEWYKKLLKLDPGAGNVVDKNNPRRIIRAIEVCLATSQPFSKSREKGEPLFDVLQIGITMPRQKVYERIDKRVDEMIKEGLKNETKKLLKKYSPSLPSMSGIGYKEIGDYLCGDFSLEEAVQKIKYRTHAYARRQMTWFKKDKRIKWIKNYKEAERKIAKWLHG